MTMVPTGWRKSSRSANQTNCVEVAGTLRAVRDSKYPAGQITGEVTGLVAAVKAGQFGR